ncbi:hypothetical protein ACQKDA_09705 [Psychrobacter sp. NPDC078370]|uniref:hypothetical protein n=1 Tax=Psychrobacter TaxID=497 RepID=UPI000C7F6622|nr:MULTISPECIES: hypothetical protein [Psychrobacter]PLT21464.1 hypothetical protein CXF62_10035 [Psychrobacter sp. MES7-P7E]|tara:strand:- start:3050 stop:4159 length:1110 start_codon:yes stop_codon:yes gene_type:complete
MTSNDVCVLWQLSAKKKLDSNDFECRLILEYKDRTSIGVIDINTLGNNEESWLRLIREEAPFSGFSESDIPIKYNLSLFISCFMDFNKLRQLQPKLKYVYLWIAARHVEVGLETVYPLSDLKDVESRASNRIFVQMYPKIPSQKYVDLEDDLGGVENFQGLLEKIQGQSEQTVGTEVPVSIKKPKATKKLTSTQDIKVVKKSVVTQEVKAAKEPIIEAKSRQDISSVANSSDGIGLEILGTENADVIWGIFSKQDLDDLVEGFKDWERVHGKNTLLARLPKSLADKIGGEFNIVFWTSGQGISNMVVDDRPPRHTMVMGLVKSVADNISHGIGYCIQRPTSLDKMWTHQKWHALECQDNDILKVTTVIF